MEDDVLVVLINPFGNQWSIVGDSTRFEGLTVPEEFGDVEAAESLAKEKAQLMGCETRVVQIRTLARFLPQPIQIEITRNYKELGEENAGEPTRRIG